ncbi:MAG: hypothetical protein MJE77_10205 [Proteobacteria bacterium]|nr:hypothetical protein [Pseudomonadota bacterium]
MSSLKLLYIAVCLLSLISGLTHADPITLTEPVAPAIEGDGTGLCSAVAQAEFSDFDNLNNNVTGYNGIVNAFMETHKADRRPYVINTVFDLSNNLVDGTDQSSYGDFVGVMPASCAAGGCSFSFIDQDQPFFSRLRGFLNVTPELAGREIHIGFYADDSVSLTFFDKNLGAYPMMVRPPQLGVPTWRLTETITFETPGLYPLEILYGEIDDHAALEMSFFIGSFADFERSAKQVPVVRLDEADFTLFPQTMFFQTLSGLPSFPDDLLECKQCNRQFVGLPGNNDCELGYYCNEAALCAPCDSALFCGPTCSPCGGASPFCTNLNGRYQCTECRDDSDCRPGSVCDQETFACVECDTDNACAGNSCNCCPGGSQCLRLEEGGTPVCAECTSDADCASGQCDLVVGQCVEKLAKNERADCCGENCATCPADYPYCVPGLLDDAVCAECRWDTDCNSGNYCLSGNCEPCSRDRRCGVRCGACEGNTPYCLEGQTPAQSVCVRCIDDSQCNGGTCNPVTHECQDQCTMSCPADVPHCMGQQCVECYADTQCPCGGSCDLDTFTCTETCKSNTDCLGNEHCHRVPKSDSKECAPGVAIGDSTCGTTLATACSVQVGGSGGQSSGSMLSIVVALGIVGLWRRRDRSARRLSMSADG